MEQLIQHLLTLEVAAPTVVAIVVGARLWFGSTIFHVRWLTAWNIVRRVGVPWLNGFVLGRLVPFDPELENEAYEDEFVGVTKASPRDVALAISEVADPEVPLLAGFKTDWDEREEAGTDVTYHGPKPLGVAPDWLRPRQTHRTYFRARGPDGRFYTVITAHEEANSYRPDLWRDHLFKGSFSASEGVRRTILKLEDAGVEWDYNPEWLGISPSMDPETVDGGR